MTNTTYDLKPGYYWKITPSTDPDRAAILSLMQTVTTWTLDHEVAGYHLGHSPADHKAELEKAMARIKSYYPTVFEDYTEEVVQYDKALRTLTSNFID